MAMHSVHCLYVTARVFKPCWPALWFHDRACTHGARLRYTDAHAHAGACQSSPRDITARYAGMQSAAWHTHFAPWCVS